MGKEIVVGLHFYQPPRKALHPELKSAHTDPHKKDWTDIISNECYRPLATTHTIEKASFDIFQSLLIQIEQKDPDLAKHFHKAMIENGVGEPFIHPILPDLSDQDKLIVVSAGINRFQEITGKKPRFFWPPETAIDTQTLEVLSFTGYEGFVCAPEQIVQFDGGKSDNRPTRIQLPSGRQIVALPFDRPISSKLAFDQKINADQFTAEHIAPRGNQLRSDQTIIAWTDAETFGHHWKKANFFLDYLLGTSLPSTGLYPISINSLKINLNNLPSGRINERTAWSCPHGNLIRWNGSCDCAWGEDTRWKRPFYAVFRDLNENISKVLERELGADAAEQVSSEFYRISANPYVVLKPREALIAAKISSLTARTSCATFFSSPETSGKINLLYGYQSLLYLRDTGLVGDFEMLSANFTAGLSGISYPGTSDTAMAVLEKMVS